MAKLTTRQIDQMGAAAGMHLGAAVGAFLAIALDQGDDVSDTRATFMRVCGEMFDEVAAELPLT